MPRLDRIRSRYSNPFQLTLSWASIGGLIHKPALFLRSHWPIMVGGPNDQDAEKSCSHLGTMVEFAVALGSKLGVINKHSFNDFRLRVGKGPPLPPPPLPAPHYLFSSSSLDTPSSDLVP